MTKNKDRKTESVMPQTPPLLRLKDAAGKIGISPDKLRKMINRGEGPPFVIFGRDMMFRETTIDSWLAKREENR